MPQDDTNTSRKDGGKLQISRKSSSSSDSPWYGNQARAVELAVNKTLISSSPCTSKS